jgi:hypothetical protein
MNTHPNLGEIITTSHNRDAIHVAVAPVTAGEWLVPGTHVRIAASGLAIPGPRGECVGIVDPFLRQHVLVGERFWLMLYPGTITSLRHAWSHPALPEETGAVGGDKAASEAWLLRFCEEHGLQYNDVLEEFPKGGCVSSGTRELYIQDTEKAQWSDLWIHLEVATGKPIPQSVRNEAGFRCAC